jgi:CRP/FNR family transcriptional regulator, cyclic AMP receptor protein
MDVGKIASLLGRAELFEGLEPHTLREIAERGRLRFLPKGRSIFIQDQPGASCFVLLEGTVRLYVLSDDGRLAELVRHSRPTVFGELAVLDGGLRSASAEVVEDARLVELDRETLMAVIRSNHAALDALLRSLVLMVRRTTRQVTDLRFGTVRSRLAGYLLALAVESGSTGPIKLVPQAEIAEIVGGTRQRVNLALHELEQGGSIRLLSSSTFEIRDIQRLRVLSIP